MATQNKPTLVEVREFRNALTERGFSRESRYEDTKFYKEFGIVQLWVHVNMTKKGEFKNLEAVATFNWVDYMRRNELPSRLTLGKKPVRSLDMDYVKKCEGVASGMEGEIKSLATRLERMAETMQVSHIKDTRQWITNGNADGDDRVDDAQSWGIFG